MDGDLNGAMRIAAAGMKVQGTRLRVIAENLANADSTSTRPGGDPYARKIVTFASVLDRETGLETVAVEKVTKDKSEFTRKYDPSHPAANDDGYVLLPNVSTLIETVDMQEAQRSYQANLNSVEAAKAMTLRTLDILR